MSHEPHGVDRLMEGRCPPPAVRDPHGRFAIYQGDCRFVMPLLPDESIDMVFADPPYFLSNDGITCQAGKMVSVNKGKTTDVGNIEMLIYKELKIAAAGVRTNANQVTEFSYSFNYDVTLSSLTIAWPGGGSNVDPGAPGVKTAGTTYTSAWNAGGAEMPSGAHVLNFTGTFDGVAFDVDVMVSVP